MTDNIKQFLHTWCSQSHKQAPTYNIVNQGGKGNQRLRFNCEVTVDGFSYTGYGSSTNKKDAQTNAARDFVNFLVRENVIQKNSVPEFKKTEIVGEREEPKEQPLAANVIPPELATSQLDNANRIYFNNIFDQKKLEEAEDVDFTADIHGYWSLDNAKARLHQYMQQHKIQSEYKHSAVGPDHNKSFVCEMTIFCNKLKKDLYAREAGSNKQTSSKACALSIVRQMFHLGVIEAFSGVTKKVKSDQIPPFKVTVNEEVKQQLSEVIQSLGLQPKQKPEIETKEEINMVVNYTIVDFEPQTHQRPQVIPWSPAMPNWNAWVASNIDEGEQAFLTLDEISLRLKDSFMKQRSTNKDLQRILQEREALPAAAFEEAVVQATLNNQVVLIRGETGSGKTTQVPQFIMDYHIQMNKGAECNIIVTQPRRISAITLAERVAQERGELIGQSCGYSVRFETVYPQPYGSLLYCTVGTLLRKMEGGLRGISHLIVDEIHERDLNTDFLMILLKDMAASYPQLKILLMSATIDIELFKAFFPNIYVLEIEGRTFPVNYYFLEDCIEMLDFQPDPVVKKDKKSGAVDVTNDNDDPRSATNKPDESDLNCNLICSETYKLPTRLAMCKLSEKEINFELIEAILKYIENIHPDGAVLIFLPGWNIIQMLLKHLNRHPIYGSARFLLLPLHSQIPRVDQKKVFHPCRPGVRKIILATNIAESSITINDVMFVIDSCRAKVKMFTSRNNLTSYNTVWASKTNLEQRRGRAGRVCEGYSFHLCSRARYERLETHQTPEILRTALHDLALMVKLLKLGNTKAFLAKALEQPPIDAIIEAEHLLKEIKAFDKNDELTPLGRILARLPIEPRMGKMIIFGCLFGVGDACTIIAACTSLGDPLVIPPDRKRLSKAQVELAADRCSDHVAILNAFQKWNGVQKRGLSEEEYCDQKGLNLSILRMSKDAASQMKSILVNAGFPEDCLSAQFFDYRDNCSMLNNVINLLVLGLYPNVCYHKEKRKVFTTEGKPALVHKSSVNCSNFVNSFPSPFFIFGEKIRTRAISCKQLSMINPLQLLIFGSRKVSYIDKVIVIDDWLTLDMDFELAAEILALRPALEGLMVKVCMNPDIIMNPENDDSQLMNIVTQLSHPSVCTYENLSSSKNPFDNRKRKPWTNQQRFPYNQNNAVPYKYRAMDRPGTNVFENKVPGQFNTQRSFNENNFNRYPSFTPQPQRPMDNNNNNNSRIPNVNNPNSSFIRNRFVQQPNPNAYNEYEDDYNSSFQRNKPSYLLNNPSFNQEQQMPFYDNRFKDESMEYNTYNNNYNNNSSSYNNNNNSGYNYNNNNNNNRVPYQPLGQPQVPRMPRNNYPNQQPHVPYKRPGYPINTSYNSQQSLRADSNKTGPKTYEKNTYDDEPGLLQKQFHSTTRGGYATDRSRLTGPGIERSSSYSGGYSGEDMAGSMNPVDSCTEGNEAGNTCESSVENSFEYETPDLASGPRDIVRGHAAYFGQRRYQNFSRAPLRK